MAARARTPLPDLPQGHLLPDTTFALSGERLGSYLDAVGDANVLYRERRLAPPLAVAAFALGTLLDLIELPAGALHTNQSLDVRAGLPIDATLTLSGRVAQRSQRAGMTITAIDFEVTPAGAASPSLTGRTTILVPDAGREGAGA